MVCGQLQPHQTRPASVVKKNMLKNKVINKNGSKYSSCISNFVKNRSTLLLSKLSKNSCASFILINGKINTNSVIQAKKM